MGDNSGVRQIRERVDGVLANRHDELYGKVRACVAEALAIDSARIAPQASLIDDLGAESLDFLDLTFRLERTFGVKIPRDGILMTVRQGLDGNFDDKGVLSEPALERLRLLMPEVRQDSLVTGLRTHDVPHLFTAETFLRLVAWRLADQAAA